MSAFDDMATIEQVQENPQLLGVLNVQNTKYEQDGKYRQYKKGEISEDVFVHEYVGPLGPGYLIYEYKTVDKERWFRVLNFGPETWHERDWAVYSP